MYTDNKSLTFSILFPSIVKFSLELVTWISLLILSLTVNILFAIPLFISILSMALFTFPGDKAHDGPVSVSGWLRILIELIFVALLGLYSCFILFGIYGLLVQTLLVLITIIFEFQRYLWMLGFKSSPPEYVTYWKNFNT